LRRCTQLRDSIEDFRHLACDTMMLKLAPTPDHGGLTLTVRASQTIDGSFHGLRRSADRTEGV
jgi:hypothetical protein